MPEDRFFRNDHVGPVKELIRAYRMKILYLSRALLPSQVTHSLSIMRLCQAFADSGHSVVLTGIASSSAPTDPISHYGLRGGFGVTRHRLSRLLDNRFFQPLFVPGIILALKTRKLFDTFSPDVVYSRLTLGELALVPRHVPIIYEMHSLGFLGKSRWQRMAFLLLLRRKTFQRIIVTTDKLAETLRQELPDVEILVARLSAERPVPVHAEMQRAFRVSELRGDRFEYHIGYTGYLDTIGLRGTEIVCQAAAQMPEVAFHVVGGEAKIVEHWRRYAHDYDTHGNIFFYGYRRPAEIPLFLGCFDVVMAPLQVKASSRAPGGLGMSPLKLPEYMSYGKPIVASDIPAHREVLLDGHTALLVPPANVDAWVSAIRCLIRDPERRAALGARAREQYLQAFSPEMRVRTIFSGLTPQVADQTCEETWAK
jgi:glycosyltransferase involved in cell wall biosynthesis